MEIVLISGLKGPNADSIYKPISMNQDIEKIYWITDYERKVNRKLKCFSPPDFLKEKQIPTGVKFNRTFRISIPKICYKFFKSIMLSSKNEVKAVVSVLLYPHGLISMLTSKITNKRWTYNGSRR